MKNILSVKEAIQVSQRLRANGKRLVLVGGCFDILHIGHIIFLEKAKEKGDALLVLLESDASIQQNKGVHRPITNQKERARMLASLRMVDYIIMLPHFTEDSKYDVLVRQIKPAIIAATKKDPAIMHKKRSAKLSGAQVVYVTNPIYKQSTSRIVELLAKENSL